MESEVESFLRSVLPIAEDEPGTTTWFALRMDESTSGIFDTLPDDDARRNYLDGEIAAALMLRVDELLAVPPRTDELDVLAAKHIWAARPSAEPAPHRSSRTVRNDGVSFIG